MQMLRMPVQLYGWNGFDRALRILKPRDADARVRISLRDASFVRPSGLAHLFAIVFTLHQLGYELAFDLPASTDVARYLQRTDFWGRLRRNGVVVPAEWDGTNIGNAPGLIEIQEIPTSGPFWENVRATEVLYDRFVIALRSAGIRERDAAQIWIELCDNAAEHSEGGIPAFVCAQRYGDALDIAIVDFGRGVLAATRHLGFASDSEAVTQALEYGVTGRASGEGGIGLYTARCVADSLVIRSRTGLWESAGGRNEEGALTGITRVCQPLGGTLVAAQVSAVGGTKGG